MIIHPSFNLKQFFEVYPIAQIALQILLAIYKNCLNNRLDFGYSEYFLP